MSKPPRSRAPRPRGSGSLYIYRHKDGTGSWYARFRVGGEQMRVTLGPVKEGIFSRRGLSRRAAEKALAALMAQTYIVDLDQPAAIDHSVVSRDLKRSA